LTTYISGFHDAEAPVPSGRIHNFPNGKPLLLSLLEVLYLIAVVGWFSYWWLALGFRSWWYGLPIVFIVIAFGVMRPRLLAHYERNGDATPIGRPPSDDLK
jgi:hypothetical protein